MDLGEFPAGYKGRQTYVKVRGHAGLIAVCHTYRGYDGHNYLLGDDAGYKAKSDLKTPYIMRDIGAYQSPIDGAMITSRSAHREHLRTHDVIEVGNERMPTHAPDLGPSPREIGEVVKRRLEEVRAIPQAAYDAQVKAMAHGPE